MARFPIEAVRSVDFVVPDLEAAIAFYTDIWGLFAADRTADAAWLRGTGEDAQILALREGSAPGIASMTLRVAADADPQALASGMVAHGGTLIASAHPADEPGGGEVTIVRDPVGRTFRFVQNDARVAPRTNEPDRPERIAHVNINSDDVARDTALFTDALGFTLTDRSQMMAFVRTNADHHSVVIAQAPVNTLNHVAFQLPGWENVMRAAGRLVDHRFPIGWGPGRHGPGNNVFAYFVDPFGFVVEHTADVLQVDDAYRVGGPDDWIWPAGRTDQWGICPPKTAACKTAQLAIPFL